ncbi:hypothetical protein DQG23_10630, partial [Paenibacillus contaminans]
MQQKAPPGVPPPEMLHAIQQKAPLGAALREMLHAIQQKAPLGAALREMLHAMQQKGAAWRRAAANVARDATKRRRLVPRRRKCCTRCNKKAPLGAAPPKMLHAMQQKGAVWRPAAANVAHDATKRRRLALCRRKCCTRCNKKAPFGAPPPQMLHTMQQKGAAWRSAAENVARDATKRRRLAPRRGRCCTRCNKKAPPGAALPKMLHAMQQKGA